MTFRASSPVWGLRPALPLVKERLTIPASAASEQQVRQAVDHAIAAYDPGTAALSVQLSGGVLLRLLQTVSSLGLAGVGLYFLAISFHRSPSIAPPGDPFASVQKVFTVLPGIFTLVALRRRSHLRSRRMGPAHSEVRGRGAVGAVASDPDPAGRAGARLLASPGH